MTILLFIKVAQLPLDFAFLSVRTLSFKLPYLLSVCHPEKSVNNI